MTTTTETTHWQDDATCAHMNPADIERIFYEPAPRGRPGGVIDTTQYEEAAAICAECPVLAECRTYTLGWETGGTAYRWGYAAGMTPEQRANAYRATHRKSRTNRKAS